MRANRLAQLASLAMLTAVLSACSSNLSRFDVVLEEEKKAKETDKITHQITRAEVADQGSGNGSSIVGPGGHSLTKLTVGGYYLRRVAVGAPTGAYTGSNYRITGGLHGNPRASK